MSSACLPGGWSKCAWILWIVCYSSICPTSWKNSSPSCGAWQRESPPSSALRCLGYSQSNSTNTLLRFSLQLYRFYTANFRRAGIFLILTQQVLEHGLHLCSVVFSLRIARFFPRTQTNFSIDLFLRTLTFCCYCMKYIYALLQIHKM
jgi:hypothetical protein